MLALLWVTAFFLAAMIGTHGIAYWDAGDYVQLALNGGQSGLLLGRPLYLAVSRGVLSLGIDPSRAEVALRWFWSGVSACAAPALAVLASRLGLPRAEALLSGLLLAVSPSFAHTSHQVLTDSPALALSIAALVLAAGGRAIAAGVVLAAAILTRETAAIHIVAMTLLLRRQSLLALGSCALVVIAAIMATAPPGLTSWLTSMSGSAAAHPLSPADVGVSLAWLLAAGPVPVIAGAIALPRAAPRIRLVALPAALACAALLFYPDGAFSPRYMLAAAPIAFFISGAPLLFRLHKSVLVIGLVIPLVVASNVARESDKVAARGAALVERIAQLPDRALLVPGHFCPQARLAATVLHRGDLGFVCPGWEWPADLAAVLDQALHSGRPVVVDTAEDAWIGPREADPRGAARAWLAGRQTGHIAGFTLVVR